jgi:flagellar export protein FliJ
MKSLRTLIKLARRNLDVLRRHLAEQFAKLADVELRMRTHEQTILDEQKAALRDYEATRAYGGFAAAAIDVRHALHIQAQIIQQEIERLRVVMAEAHVEVRKFERLLELHQERERAAERKREDAELDEIATMRAARSSPA